MTQSRKNPSGSKRVTGYYSFPPEEFDDIIVSEQVARWHELTTGHVEWLASDIATNGQTDPIVFRRVGSQAEVIKGRHRLAALKLIRDNFKNYGLSKPISLFGIEKKLDDEGAIIASFDHTMLPVTCIDLASAAAKLSNKGWKQEDIARVLSNSGKKINQMRVSQLLGLMDLPESIKHAIHVGDFPESAAKHMLRMDLNKKEMEEMAAKVEKGELKAADIASRANQQRREQGAQVKRTLKDLFNILEEVATEPAMKIYSWLNGSASVPDSEMFVILQGEPAEKPIKAAPADKPAPKKRGRPPKKEASVKTTPPKKRGRPRKAKPLTPEQIAERTASEDKPPMMSKIEIG